MTGKNMTMLGIAFGVLVAVVAWWQIRPPGGPAVSATDAALLEEGLALFGENRYEDAFEAMRRIPKGSPIEWQARYYQGSALILMENYHSAVGYLEQALALNDRETPIIRGLGLAHYHLREWDQARAYFSRVLELDPYDGESRSMLEAIEEAQR